MLSKKDLQNIRNTISAGRMIKQYDCTLQVKKKRKREETDANSGNNHHVSIEDSPEVDLLFISSFLAWPFFSLRIKPRNTNHQFWWQKP